MSKWILFGIGIYLFLLLFIYVDQRNFIYLPRSGDVRPERWGLSQVKWVHIKTQDGLTLNAWFSPPKSAKTPTILYLHGNAAHIGYRVDRVRSYVQAGYGLLLLSYRGYGGSEGSPTELGLYQDARASIDFLKSKGIHTQCLVLFGESLGAGVAVQMGTEFDVGAIILQSSYSSLVDLGKKHYPIFPVSLLLKDRFESIHKIQKIQTPLLFLHGQQDDIVPISYGRKLYLAANPPKEMKIYAGAGHNTMPDVSSDVVAFLKKYAVCSDTAFTVQKTSLAGKGPTTIAS